MCRTPFFVLSKLARACLGRAVVDKPSVMALAEIARLVDWSNAFVPVSVCCWSRGVEGESTPLALAELYKADHDKLYTVRLSL